jgi:undecaprenyl-diphosphatase
VVRAGPGRGGWIALAAGLFTALAALAVGINADWLASLDTSVADWFDAHRSRRRDQQAAGVFGYIGRPVHVLVVAAVCGTLLSIRARSAIPVIGVTGAVGLGVVIEQTLKAVIGRTASAGPLVDYPHSFPSGHVTGTAALLGTIAVFLGAGANRAVRTTLAGLVVAVVIAVAVLALYTGAHTVSDVIGGMLLGGAFVALCAAGVQRRGGRLAGDWRPAVRK